MEREQFEKLCQLARLGLSAEERSEFERKFSRLLEFVEAVQGYTPQTEGLPLTLAERVELRLDNVAPFDWRASQRHDYRVPQIIDFEGGG